jgi:formylglycine-generating enzyme required for sulfatase activity
MSGRDSRSGGSPQLRQLVGVDTWREVAASAGSSESLEGLDEHPVVLVACEDVEAYARLAGMELANLLLPLSSCGPAAADD